MEKFLCAVLLVAYVGCAQGTGINKCKSGLPQPIAVDVKDCVEQPCKFPRGQTAEWNITFDAPHDLETFEPSLVATAMGIDVDYPLNEKEGCKELIGDECPLEEGQRVVYGTGMFIQGIFPVIPVGIEMTLSAPDEDGAQVPFTCFQINVEVV